MESLAGFALDRQTEDASGLLEDQPEMTPLPPAEWSRLLASWSDELLSATNRIHHLIGHHHQPTKGSYREALLRRVLPDRFRVSTGFIYRWGDEPSRQLDVLVWDAYRHSALLEEGELVILTSDAVAAIIEVKSMLGREDLRDALRLLSPSWLVNWSHPSDRSVTGLKQQVPSVPFRGVFAYTAPASGPDSAALAAFRELTEFYREQFGDDARAALAHRGGPGLRWLNLIDAVCIADSLEIEQTSLMIGEDGALDYEGPGFVAFRGQSTEGNLAVGKFCMFLLWHLHDWHGAEAPAVTFNAPWPILSPGVCCFSAVPADPKCVRVWGTDVPPEALWSAVPPLWRA